MVTIYDIAKKLGCSAPTVSKALNGTGTLNNQTRKKIVAVAEEMGYKPNLSARTLTTKKSNLIGVIYDDTGMNRGFSHPLFSVLLDRFREQVEYAGYDLVFLSRHFKMSYYEHSQYRSVDGVIIINPATGDIKEFADFISSDMPRVSTNCLFEGICTVISDNEKGGYDAAEYLIKKGHRKIAFISAPINRISSAPLERLNGFKKALADYNVPFDEELFEESKMWDKQGAFEAFSALYARCQDFTAVFCATDLLAFGVYEFAEQHNIKIPDAFSIVGFDDDEAAAYMAPHLTTFRQDALRIADIASEMMLNQIAGLPVPEIVRCEAHFVERQSVREL